MPNFSYRCFCILSPWTLEINQTVISITASLKGHTSSILECYFASIKM